MVAISILSKWWWMKDKAVGQYFVFPSVLWYSLLSKTTDNPPEKNNLFSLSPNVLFQDNWRKKVEDYD